MTELCYTTKPVEQNLLTSSTWGLNLSIKQRRNILIAGYIRQRLNILLPNDIIKLLGLFYDGGSESGTVAVVEHEAIQLKFIWGNSCFRGKYPKWTQPAVTELLLQRGLTNKKLQYELKLIQHQITKHYGVRMKYFVVIYVFLFVVAIGCIAAQFGIAEYRSYIIGIFDANNSIKFDMEFMMDFKFIICGILLILIFLVCLIIHRMCWSKRKYKTSMKELKDYLYGFEMQNKYTLIKWVDKHTIDNIQFNIIVKPLTREKHNYHIMYFKQ